MERTDATILSVLQRRRAALLDSDWDIRDVATGNSELETGDWELGTRNWRLGCKWAGRGSDIDRQDGQDWGAGADATARVPPAGSHQDA
jgi:hypothetical protein